MKYTIKDGRKKVWQWDIDVVLTLEGVADGTEIHLGYSATTALKKVVENGEILIPNVLLTRNRDIPLFVYHDDATHDSALLPVEGRPKPPDYVYTEPEKLTWEQLEIRIEALEKRNGHDHGNKDVLDGITADRVTAWDSAEQNAKDHADKGLSSLEKKIPTKTSQITNDSGFITNAVVDLAYYYQKHETYTRDEIMVLMSGLPKFSIEVVSALPTSDISTTTIYLVKTGVDGGDLYQEYIYVNGAWENLGSQKVEFPTTLYVTVTPDEAADHGYTVDKTFEELRTANDAARPLVCRFPVEDGIYYDLPLLTAYDGAFLFLFNDGETVYEVTIGLGGDALMSTEVYVSKSAAKYYPTAVKNPFPLTINGQSYDGSAAVEITITGDSSEGTTETVLSDNMFDKSTVTWGKGFYHSSSGTTIVDVDSYFGMSYVYLRGAGTYRTKVCVTHHSEAYAARVPLMKEDKTWIQNITGTVTDTGIRDAWDLEFTVTEDMVAAGAAIYPLTVSTSTVDTLMFVKDREYPSEYIPYGYIEVTVEDADPVNVLSGKTAVFLGDSICAGTTVGEDSEYYGWGWAGLIGEANRMTWKNYGRNGGTITPVDSVDEARWVTTQADLAQADYPNADYVIFEGGTNDAYTLKETGLGEISDDFATFDTSTFSGAMESLILKILTAFPNAQVGYIVAQKMGVPPYTTANIQRVYFNRAVEICQKWGIPVIDLWNGGLLNPALDYHSATFYTDKQHLTLAGYQRISPQIEAWMRNLNMPGVVSESSGGGQSDWNAAEGEPGHVKNRTHYEDWVEIMPEQVVSWSDDIAGLVFPEGLSLTVGKRYKVTWNGATYERECFHVAIEEMGVAFNYIGNLAALGMEDTGEPFMIADMGMLSGADVAGATEATVSMSEFGAIPLDRRYLPKMSHTIKLTADQFFSGNMYKITDNGETLRCLDMGLPVYVDFTELKDGVQVVALISSWRLTINATVDGAINAGLDYAGIPFYMFATVDELNASSSTRYTIAVNTSD